MARIKRDKDSWHARSILRRDARHNIELTGDAPSTGKVRGRRFGRRKGCEHVEWRHSHTRVYSWSRTSYDVSRCVRCGKEKWERRAWMPLPEKQVTKADEKFFPVHEPGTCGVCDKRRKGG